jgi:hypothetical protein
MKDHNLQLTGMSTGRVTVVLVALVKASLLSSCIGCSETHDYGPFDETWETQHVTYKARSGDAGVCRGAEQTVERYLLALAAQLGIQESQIPHITYYKYESQEAMQAWNVCNSGSTGCSDAEGVWDVRPVNGHELVHTLLINVLGHRAHLLMGEGMATALSCEPFWRASNGSFDPDWAQWASGNPTLEQYKTAGRIVSTMVYAIGLPAVLDLYNQTYPNDSLADLNAKVSAVLGMDLEALWQSLQQNYRPYCLPVYACSGAELSEGLTTAAVGCRGYDAIVLPKRSGEVVRLYSDLTLDITRCRFADIEGSVLPHMMIGTDQGMAHKDLAMVLPQEPFALTFEAPEDVGAQARSGVLSLANSPGDLTASCTQSVPSDTIDAAGLGIFVPHDGQARVQAFTQTADRQLFITHYEQPPWQVRKCSSCVDGVLSACEDIPQAVRQPITAQAGEIYLTILPQNVDNQYSWVGVTLK